MTDSQSVLLPSKQVLMELMDLVSHSPEGAEYLSRNFKALLAKRNMLKQFHALIVKFEAYAKEVKSGAESATDGWRGERPLSVYANASEQRARTAEKDMPSTPIEKVAIGIDFGVNGELNRGYMLNNESADAQATTRLDVPFHAWFARQGFLFNQPFLYQATESGDVKINAEGQPLRVNLDEFKQIVEADEGGLKSYFDSHVHGVDVNFVQVRIAAVAPEVDAAPAA